MALMLTPHSLALVGSLAAQLGGWQPYCLALVGGLYIVNASTYGKQVSSALSIQPECDPAVSTAQTRASLVLLLSGRLVTALMGAAILTVSAGYLFNEIFVYWFPNFAFAYLMLAAVVVIQLFGSTAADKAQVIFTCTAASGIAVLIILGLTRESQDIASQGIFIQRFDWPPLAAAMFLFVGFDLVVLSPAARSSNANQRLTAMITGIIMAAMLLGLWGLVSLRHVAAAQLEETTVAHIVAAISLAGPAGMKIIGIASIAGAFAGVNALLRSVSVVAADLASSKAVREDGASTTGLVNIFIKPGNWAIAFGLLIGIMLAAGMAGSDRVDVYLRAGLIFWLIHYAVIHWQELDRNRPSAGRRQRALQNAAYLMPLLGLVLSTLGIGGLIASDANRWILIGFMGLIYALLWLLVTLSAKLRHRSSTTKIRFNR